MYTLQRELYQRLKTLIHGGVCLGGNPNIDINAEIILEIIVFLKGAEMIIKALTRGVIAKALIQEMANKIFFKKSQIKLIAGEVVDLKNKLIN